MGILQDLRERVLICDGGMGSLLQEAGLKAGELPETWNLLHPDVIRGIHLNYLKAGADIVTTNTFGANALKYGAGSPYLMKDIVRAALENAKAAVEEAGRGYIALDLGPTGKLIRPMGDLLFEDCISIYKEVVREGAENGADLVLIETMSDVRELKAAVLAVKEESDLPVFASVSFDAKGRLLTGGTPESVAALLEGLRVDAIGINCGLGPVQLKGLAERLIRATSLPVLVNPNAGLPRTEGNRTVYDIGPEEFAEAMGEILDLGASIVGGCCGTTPEHIALLGGIAGNRPAPLRTPRPETVISSYSGIRVIGDDPTIIGEEINPTGKKTLKEALRNGNSEYVLSLALSEERAGAHALDVNAGLPEIDEAEVLPALIEEIQSVTDLPLQIDTSDPKAMERALRVYSGKPLINSVSGKQEVMDAIFPLAAKYGGVLVALLLDERGIPETAEERIAIARRIYAEAGKYGIQKRDILVDCLCLTVSSDQRSAGVVLETIRRVREELGGRTILGVSNISFGLPRRELVTSTFFAMALNEGLSAAIINPESEVQMNTFRSFRVLAGYDRNCVDYVEKYAGTVSPEAGKRAHGGREASGGSGSRGGAAGSGENGAGMAAGDAGENRGGNSRNAAGKNAAGKSTAGKSAAGKNAPGKNALGKITAGEDTAEERRELLLHAVERGLKEQAADLAGSLLESLDGTAIIESCMIPALDRVGRDFESGTIFLPQLLMSADAAKAAFAVISEAMAGDGSAAKKRGPVILATVKGDIHDIGKNIVKVLLENYGYEVIDLGKDVPPERIVEETLKRGVRLVGLSALMTTTVGSMEETIRQLKAASPGTKIAVGGAVLTEEYAGRIGADAYCADAMATVNYAARIFD